VKVNTSGGGTIRAAYVIGADGAHSVVRHALGLKFTGASYPQHFLLGDVHVDWDVDPGRMRIFLRGNQIGLFLPLHGQQHARVMTSQNLSASEAKEDDCDVPLPLAELEAEFAKISGRSVTLSEPVWLARFRTHHRVVNKIRGGRVFVVGDAAHIHSPAGGQGMNTGMQDAANLAWKLVASLRGEGSDSLLDSYQAERLPVAQEVLRFTDRLFNLAAGQHGWYAHLRDWVAPLVVHEATSLDEVQHRAFRKFGQLDLAYPGTSLGLNDGGRRAVSPAAGDRAPNARLSRHQDLFDLTAGYRFAPLALSRAYPDPTTLEMLEGELAELRERYRRHAQAIKWLSSRPDRPHPLRSQVAAHRRALGPLGVR
jgi:hypothetical protein